MRLELIILHEAALVKEQLHTLTRSQLVLAMMLVDARLPTTHHRLFLDLAPPFVELREAS